MDRFNEARTSNIDRQFKSQALDLLERIAVALERNGISYPEEPRTLEPRTEPVFNSDAISCTCGADPLKACTKCTPARLAWFYSMNPGATLT